MMDDKQAVIVTSEPPRIEQYQEQASGPKLSIQEAAVRWTDEVYELNSRSDKTVTAYKSILAKFDIFLQSEGFQLDSDPRQVAMRMQEWVVLPDPGGKQKKEALSHSTINQRYAALSSFYAFAIRFGAC